MGRIARHDFPRFWPDIISQLLASVRSAFEIEQRGEEHWMMENVLTSLGAVVKELSSVKLGLSVAAFHQVMNVPECKLKTRSPLRSFDF
jgi:hypothetical protein